jgi:hypothetical protein
MDLLPHLTAGLRHPHKAVRHMCARCISVVCHYDTTKAMHTGTA